MSEPPKEIARRSFLSIAAAGASCIAGAAAVSPFVRSMGPSTDIEAQRTVSADLSDVASGAMKVIEWQGRPVFIVHRTEAMIEKAQSSTVIEPADDKDRVQRPEWLILDGTCQHLGCIPGWEPGDEHAWLCRCHGSRYDFSGRAIKGPTPANLLVPPYRFVSDSEIMLGEEA